MKLKWNFHWSRGSSFIQGGGGGVNQAPMGGGVEQINLQFQVEC